MMSYFNIDKFIQDLHELLLRNNFKFENRSVIGEPLKFKISKTPKDFAFLTFEDVNGVVRVVLDFSYFSSDEFKFHLVGLLEYLIKE